MSTLPTPPLTLGKIVYARVLDSRGSGEYKRRPLVVVVPPSCDDPTFTWVGASTVPPTPEQAPYCVQLPHAGPPRGHRYTRLTQPTFVYCYWSGTLRLNEIVEPANDILGQVHEVQLEQILKIVAKLEAEAKR